MLVREAAAPPGIRRWLDGSPFGAKDAGRHRGALHGPAWRAATVISCATDPRTGEEVVWGLAPQRGTLTSDFTSGRSS